MKTILVTSGRAPVALELVRLLRAAGHRVVMAETLRWHLSRPSWAVARNYTLPWPTRDPDEYLRALGAVIAKERVDLLVPTCEEIFYIARGRDRLPSSCTVFAPRWDTLRALHSKWEFVEVARRHGLHVPATELLETREALLGALASGRELVLKPVYSRFASHTVVRPKNEAAVGHVHPTREHPWVAQEFVPGRQFCTFSVAHGGRLLAHAAYPMEFTTGLGPAIAFSPMEHPTARGWVEALVGGEGYTGQIGLDLIETEDGRLFAIECNPRATSGVHLYRGRTELADVYTRPQELVGPPLTPLAGRPAIHALPMLVWAARYARTRQQLSRWVRTFVGGRDVVVSLRDPMPLLLLSLSLFALAARCWRHRLPLDRATTVDMEWNGD